MSAYERVSVTVHRSSRMRTMSPRRGTGTGIASPESAVAVPSRNGPVHAHSLAACCGKCHAAEGRDGQEMRTPEGEGRPNGRPLPIARRWLRGGFP
jgi:cytochrome c553